MKRIFLLLTLLTTLLTVRAQMGGGAAATVTGKISGTVIDSLTKKPLDYATVTLFRAKGKIPLNGVVTDTKGNFKFNEINPGNYKLTVTFIGYPTKTLDLVATTPGKPDNSVGTIFISPASNLLGAVSVAGKAPVIENHVDKLVYNAERDATVSGGNAGDVLRKVPMVSVDQDGNVSLRGSQNVKILINGKPSGAIAASAADAMKMFPADQIKSVEVITSPSAKYDAEGTAGIINIITKKKDFSGTSGSVSGGVGTRQNNGNVNLNIKKNRTSFTSNLGSQYSWPQTSILANSTVKGTTVLSQQNGTNETKRVAVIGSGSLGYDFNASNSISTAIRLNQIQFSTDGTTVNTGLLPNYSQTSNNTVKFGGYDWNGDFTHKFKKEGHELTFAGQWSHGINSTDYTALYTSVNPNQQTNNDGRNNEYTAQVDYALPVSNVLKFETGGKSIFRRINSDYDIFRQYSGGAYTFDNNASNQYDYSQDVYAGYGVLTFTLKKGYSLQTGARVENTQIDGKANSVSGGLLPFSNAYTNFVPSVSVAKSFKGATIKMAYNKRIARPSLQYLNPFRNTSNLQYQSMGNPYLSPEVSQNLELTLTTFIKSSIINASVFYRHTNDAIESFLKQDSYVTTTATGVPQTVIVNLTTFNNIGNSNSLGSNVFGQFTIANKLTLRGNLNLFSYQPNANSALAVSSTQSGKTYVLYNAFASGSYSFPKGLTAETFAIANAPRRTLQGKNPSFNMWVLSMSKVILNKKGKIGLNVIDPFNERKNFDSHIDNGTSIQNTHFALPFRSYGVNFSWQFGKLSFADQQPKKKRGVNNDDLKQDGSQGGGTTTGTP